MLSADFGNHRLVEPFPENPKFSRGDATVEFRFTGLTYLYESRVQHQIRLLGLENAWRATEIRQARYTSLPPGTYTFQVRAGFEDGTWGPVAQVRFTILPAWYQAWWFRGLVALTLLGLAFLAVRARLEALRRRNQELEALVATRTGALAQANEILRQLTVTDPLTGLKNRRFLDLTIQDDLAKVRRDYQTLERGQAKRMLLNVDMVFLMVDLDHFKHVNDDFGHAAGDLVLQQVRDRLLEAVRNTDTVIRWGGEEFLVIARFTDRRQGDILAGRILDLVRSRPFDLGHGQSITKTCSIGYCPYPVVPADPDILTWQQVVEIADRCLYAAKLSGRNGWVGTNGEFGTPAEGAPLLDIPEAGTRAQHCVVLTSFEDAGQLRWRGRIIPWNGNPPLSGWWPGLSR